MKFERRPSKTVDLARLPAPADQFVIGAFFCA